MEFFHLNLDIFHLNIHVVKSIFRSKNGCVKLVHIIKYWIKYFEIVARSNFTLKRQRNNRMEVDLRVAVRVKYMKSVQIKNLV